MSPECQELNYLFSRCVDGNRIKVPPYLENIPKAETPVEEFILDLLHRAAEACIDKISKSVDLSELPAEAMELFLNRENLMFSEFELFQMTVAWCRRNRTPVTEYLDVFDYRQMSDEQKMWILGQVPSEEGTPGLVMNGLLQSSLLSDDELHSSRLDVQGARWKCIFDSSIDHLGRFMQATSKAMEIFYRKLIVIRVNSRLTVAMYIPKQANKYQEIVVDNSVRLLSFPHSQEVKSRIRQTMPTKMDYRLFFDNTSFQLYEKQRRNTWVFMTKPGQDDAPYKDIDDDGAKRRARQSTIESGMNSDVVASIALNKFSGNLAKHIGRVNRDPILGAEVYVISNRDTRSFQVLDQWLHFVDTREILPLLEEPDREYEEPSLMNVRWSAEPEYIRLIACDNNFPAFGALNNDEVFKVFNWLLKHGQKATLRKAFTHILSSYKRGGRPVADVVVMTSMIDFLATAPPLAVTFVHLGEWMQLPTDIREILNDRSNDILVAMVTAANEMEILIVEPFRQVLAQVSHMHLSAFSSLVEHISLVIKSPEIALDLLLGCLDKESARIFSARPTVVQYFVKNCIGIAMDHIEEALECREKKTDLLELRRDADPQLVYARTRIDLHSSGRLAVNDHVELTVTNLPKNSSQTKSYSMDALVHKSNAGGVTFRCLQPLPTFVEDCTWKVKSRGSFVTTKTMFDAINDFITAPNQSCLIHDKVLGINESSYRANFGTEHTFIPRPDLNDSQNKAITEALSGNLTCIWGPPGTGKTHTIAVLLEVLVADPNRRLLVTAPTHNAVDNVMRKYLRNASLRGLPKQNAIRVSTDVCASS